MEMLALRHCSEERNALAEKRYQKREVDFLEKDREEMDRLKEILAADKHARDEERATDEKKSRGSRSMY
jgi:hypothetical protein